MTSSRSAVDYRYQILDHIQGQFGSTYRFAKEKGYDEAQLSRMLRGQRGVSQKQLERIVADLGLEIWLREKQPAPAPGEPRHRGDGEAENG